jgi:hypothetical protein
MPVSRTSSTLDMVYRTAHNCAVRILYSGYSLCNLALRQLGRILSTQKDLTNSKKYTIGAVENAGNTCFISVVLQEFAESYKYYAHMFEENHGETDPSINSLRTFLGDVTKRIRNTETIPAQDITHLTTLLVKAGYPMPRCSRLQQILNRIFPALFPLTPIGSPYVLYDTICGLLMHQDYKESDDESSFYSSWKKDDIRLNPVVIIDDDPETTSYDQYSVVKRLQEVTFSDDVTKHSLWKVRLPLNKSIIASATIETATHIFSLTGVSHFNLEFANL